MPLAESVFDYEARLAACARGERSALRDLYVQEGPRLLEHRLLQRRVDAVVGDTEETDLATGRTDAFGHGGALVTSSADSGASAIRAARSIMPGLPARARAQR